MKIFSKITIFVCGVLVVVPFIALAQTQDHSVTNNPTMLQTQNTNVTPPNTAPSTITMPPQDHSVTNNPTMLQTQNTNVTPTTNAVTVDPIPNQAESGCPAGEYCLLEPLPKIDGVSTVEGCEDGETLKCLSFNNFIEYVFKFAIAIAVLLATVMIIVGGFQWMFSETPFKIGDAKKRISNAIFGLLAALVSYLILQTIDPRLVQINTRIEPICNATNKVAGGACDPKALENFEKNYIQNLKDLSRDKQLQSLELEQRKKVIEQERKGLAEKLARGEIDGYKWADDDFILRQQLAETQLKQVQIIGEGIGLVNWRLAYQDIYGGSEDLKRYTDTTNTNAIVAGKLPVITGNIIQEKYNTQINVMRSIQPQTPEIEEAARILGLQRNFLISQATEEIELRTKIDENTYTSGVKGLAHKEIVNQNKDWLEKERDQYKLNLNNQDRIKSSGLLTDQYNMIMQMRIDRISVELAQNPPKK